LKNLKYLLKKKQTKVLVIDLRDNKYIWKRQLLLLMNYYKQLIVFTKKKGQKTYATKSGFETGSICVRMKIVPPSEFSCYAIVITKGTTVVPSGKATPKWISMTVLRCD
jgi:hypothetical protein